MIEADAIKVEMPLKKLSSLQLYEELLGINGALGFDEYHLPDKCWMIDVMKTIKPNHRFLTKPIET
jgi:hypothetical protein